MLRELQTVLNKNTPSNFKAEVAMTTGMGVAKDLAALTVGFPDAEAGVDVVLVNKERIPTGINAGRTDLSDYEEDFVKISKDEFVKLINPIGGERYAVDQFVAAGLTVGKYMAVGTDGVWKVAGAGVKSIFKYAGVYSDAGKTLALIDVAQVPGEN